MKIVSSIEVLPRSDAEDIEKQEQSCYHDQSPIIVFHPFYLLSHYGYTDFKHRALAQFTMYFYVARVQRYNLPNDG